MTPAKFLQELQTYDPEKHKIVTALRKVVLGMNKDVHEEIKYGGLLYSNEKPYTGLFVSKHHVSMEFSEGAKLRDPKKLLHGTGKYRRHLKFSSLSEINVSDVKALVKQAQSN